jgi:serine/threonine protein kinase/Tfp pilus assembly protein PilF
MSADARASLVNSANEETTLKWAPVRTDRYRILRALATGAQGKIFLAHHIHLDQICVIKFVSVTDDQWSDVAAARLRNEAQAGIRVSHPNVARVLDCDCVDNNWYFVMEYIDGMPLKMLIRDAGSFPWLQVVELGKQIAAGLQSIHEADLVHRDIKPGNLMLKPDGRVMVMDLGLVKIQSAPEMMSVTQSGQMIGTPYYMPPEQFTAEPQVGPRSDIYSLGATMYHLLIGRPPFQGAGVLDISLKHQCDPVVWPEDQKEKIPLWLREAIESCLAKKPEHRYESAAELLKALEEGAQGSRRPKLSSAGLSPRGLAVMSFRNLSRREQDDWIGEAIAEYITNRLLELENIHIADRESLERMVYREGTGDGKMPEQDRVIEAARLVGAARVVVGGYQRAGDHLRITAQMLTCDDAKPNRIADVHGPESSLFDLEDQLAQKVVNLIGSQVSPAKRRHGGAGGTDSLEAHEQYMRGRRAFAEAQYREAIQFAEQARRLDEGYMDPISLIGACYARLGKYDKAVEMHQYQERVAKSVGDDPRQAEALSNLGVMYYYQGEYGLAHEFLNKAEGLSRQLGLPGDAAKHLGNLGFVFMRLGRMHEAERAFTKAIELNKEVGDLVSLMWPYSGVGGVLIDQGRFAEAKEYFNRAKVLAEEVGDRVAMGVAHMNLGRCECLVGSYDQGQAEFQEALKKLEGTDFWNGLTLVYGYMAEMYVAQGDLDRALRCTDKRIEVAARHTNNRMEAEGWTQKARIFEKMGQTEKAVSCLKKSVEVSQRPAPYESLHRYLEEVTNRPSFK